MARLVPIRKRKLLESPFWASKARRLRVDFGVKPLIPKPDPQPPEPTMRQERTVQASIFDLFAGHKIGRELKAMSAWLDDHRELASLVAADLRRHGSRATGRQGLPAEAVLRCAVLKQHRQLSYQELAFDLENSASFRAFARLPQAWSPQKSVLHQTISAIRAETWEQINRTLIASARDPARARPGGAARQHIEADISCLKRARARPLPGLRLVRGGRLQPRPLRPPQTDLTPFTRRRQAPPASAGRPLRARLPPAPPPAPFARSASATRAAQHHPLPRRPGSLTN